MRKINGPMRLITSTTLLDFVFMFAEIFRSQILQVKTTSGDNKYGHWSLDVKKHRHTHTNYGGDGNSIDRVNSVPSKCQKYYQQAWPVNTITIELDDNSHIAQHPRK